MWLVIGVVSAVSVGAALVVGSVLLYVWWTFLARVE